MGARRAGVALCSLRSLAAGTWGWANRSWGGVVSRKCLCLRGLAWVGAPEARNSMRVRVCARVAVSVRSLVARWCRDLAGSLLSPCVHCLLPCSVLCTSLALVAMHVGGWVVRVSRGRVTCVRESTRAFPYAIFFVDCGVGGLTVCLRRFTMCSCCSRPPPRRLRPCTLLPPCSCPASRLLSRLVTLTPRTVRPTGSRPTLPADP